MPVDVSQSCQGARKGKALPVRACRHSRERAREKERDIGIKIEGDKLLPPHSTHAGSHEVL